MFWPKNLEIKAIEKGKGAEPPSDPLCVDGHAGGLRGVLAAPLGNSPVVSVSNISTNMFFVGLRDYWYYVGSFNLLSFLF